MDELRLAFLGRPQVVCDGTLLTGWSLQKSLALLAYLAVTGRPHSRQALAGLLWVDHAEAAARWNLRKVVAELRQRIPAHLTITRTEVAFDPESAYWLDVEAFERGIGRALALRESPMTGASAAALAEAMELYRGDFLLGLAVLRAPAFEEWLLLEREHLRTLALRAIHALVDYHASRAQPTRTLAYLDSLLALEPAHEEAHRHKMALLARSGQRTAALRQYEACRQALQTLDAEPDSETTALYERIRSGTELASPFPVPRHNLHAPLTPLVGRESELAEIRALLLDKDCRLLTLVGPGGAGKTHLALRVAADVQSADFQSGNFQSGNFQSGNLQSADLRSGDRPPADPLGGFDDGVYVVRLGSLPAVEAIVPAIAQALDLPLLEGAHPRQQLVEYLSGKQLLVLMDGFEQLLAGAGLLVELLKRLPGLTVLATSRARLEVEGEHLFPVQGLACPEGTVVAEEPLASSPAVRLFLAGARRVQPGFELTGTDLVAVARICHLVAGLPLAILLAASWAGMLTPAEIAAELEGEGGRGLDLLQTGGQDLSVRQRSMRAVFDQSWNLLADREREVLASLSVFRGSFTLEAVRQAAGASLWELRGLMERSLLQRAASGRYAMHELLRQYAGERLEEAPGAAEELRDRHSAYFAAAVERWWADLKGPRHQEALAEMGAELGNLHAAWNRAVDRGQMAQLDQAIEGLCYFFKWLGRYEEGESLCRWAVEGLATPDPPRASQTTAAADRARVRAKALAWQGVFCHRLGRREQAWALLQRSRDLLDDLALTGPDGAHGLPEEIQRGRAFVLWRLGNLAAEEGQGTAQRLYRQSLALYRASKDRWGTASVLEAVGQNATFSNEHDLAHCAYAESLELRQAQGDVLGSYRVLLSLSQATTAYEGQAEEEPGQRTIPTASLLHEVGLAIGAGQFARAESLLTQHRSTEAEAGATANADFLALMHAFNQLHLGHYERARSQTMACLTRFLETGYRSGIERCCCYLGLAALATGAYDEAWRWLQESVDLCHEIRQPGHLGQALALLALVARRSGDPAQARQYLGEALRVTPPARDYATFMFQVIAISAMALLLADEGQLERAIELYATVSRYPLVSNSRLLADRAARQMAAVTAQLPADTAAAAQARGRARELEAAMADLGAELGE